MIGIGSENGAEIYIGNPELLKIWELFGNAPEVSAEKHIVFKMFSGLLGKLRYAVFPIVLKHRAFVIVCMSFSAEESVDKDMVHNSSAEVDRRRKIRSVNHHTEFPVCTAVDVLRH